MSVELVTTDSPAWQAALQTLDHDVTMPSNGLAQRSHIGSCQVHRVAVREDTASADIDQHATDLR